MIGGFPTPMQGVDPHMSGSLHTFDLSDGEMYPKCIGYGKVLCINFVLGYLSVLVSDLFSLLMMILYGVLPKIGQFY